MVNRLNLVALLNVLFVFVLFNTPLLAQKCLSGDCYESFSICEYPSGARYVGNFKNGLINGKGTLYFSNGNKYSGDFKNQYRDGDGVLNYANGDVYKGQFRRGKLEGKGTLHYINGDKYQGDWFNNLSHGNGIYTYNDGNRYEGNFVNGKMEGDGTMYYTDGTTYVGSWKNSKKNGYGTLTQSDGRKWEGEWTNGSLATQQEAYESKKQKTKPVDNQPTGEYTYLDGSRWVGGMNGSYPEGNGTCYYADGDKYVGGWKEHAPHGEGVMYYKNGRVVGAVWEYGQYVRALDPPKESVVLADNSKNVPVVSKGVKIWALVVGVAAYPHMPPLKFTDDDANRYYTFLKSPEGGALPDNQINLLIDEDATHDNILANMKSIFSNADENDVIMFYFSGHGIDGAFVPYDFDGYYNRLTHEEVKAALAESKAKHKVCVADACHSGSMWAAKGFTVAEQTALNKYYKAFENSSGGTALLMSSRGSENSLEDHGLRAGIFSYFLIKGMKGEADFNFDRIISIQEIFLYTSKKVKEYTLNQQQPTISGSFDKNMPIAVSVR